MALRRGFPRQGLSARGPRRKTAWGIGPGGDGVVSITGVGSTLIGAGAASTLEGSTVVRLRGHLLIQANTAVGTQDHMTGAFGIGIVQNTAFTAGIASVPTPVTESSDENWLFHQFFSIAPPAGGETWADGVSSALRMDVDTKAMRHFDSDRILYAAVEIGAENGTVGLAVYFDSRVLVKLA